MPTATQPDASPTSTEVSNRARVWLLTNCPSPYQVELFERVHNHPNLELTIRFMQSIFRGDKPPEALTRLNQKTLMAIGVPGNRDELKVHPGGLRDAMFGKHDVFVLSGLYTSPTFLFSAIILWLRRRGFVLWLERPSEAGRPDLVWWQRWLRAPFVLYRKFLLGFLLKKARRVICMGSRAVQQYAEFGLDPAKADVLPYCCDTSRFEQVEPTVRQAVIDEFELQGRTTFLFSGQLIRRKGLEVGLEAFRRLAETHQNIAFIALGDGPLREAWSNEFVSSTKAPIIFAGHQPQEKLPGFFAAADVFVLPSRQDGWAVVINEACAARLPIVASEQTGAAHDLVEPGINGFRIEWSDVDGFYEAMRTLADDATKREAFGTRSHELVQNFTTERGCEKFCDALLKVNAS